MRKPQPKAEARKERAQQLKQAVIALLQWTEMQYAEFQYEQGTKYLHAYLKGDEYCVRIMEDSRIFWNWWKNHWTIRDAEFIHIANQVTIRRTEIIRQLYRQYNKGTMLATSIHPNAVVLNESYAGMTTNMISEALCER